MPGLVWLVTLTTSSGLSKMMQALERRYVQYFDYRRSGTLWEGRFKSSLVQSERLLLPCYRYVDCELPEQIRGSVNKGLALGNDRFKDEVETLYGPRVRQPRWGGQRKVLPRYSSITPLKQQNA